MKTKTAGYLFLFGALLTTGFAPIGYKLLSQFDALTVSLYMAFAATVVSLIYMFLTDSYSGISEIFRSGRKLLPFVFGGFTFAVLVLIFTYTAHYISASLQVVIYRTWPLIFILIAPIILRERISKYDVLAVGVGFTGLAVVLLSNSVFSVSAALLPYIALLLLSALLDACAGTMQKKYKYNLGISIFLYNLFSLITIAAVILILDPTINLSLGSGLAGISGVVFFGIIQMVLVTLLFTQTIRYFKASIVANVSISIPFITMLMDYVFLKEQILPAYFLIIASVVVGMVIQKLAPKASNYVAKLHAETLPTLYDVTAAFVNTKSNLIYDEIKDGGRVLACYRAQEGDGPVGGYGAIIEGIVKENPNCVILTNKIGTKHVNRDEFEFIKEIIGHADNDFLVLGVGKPDAVERALDNFEGRFQISPVPPNVKS